MLCNYGLHYRCQRFPNYRDIHPLHILMVGRIQNIPQTESGGCLLLHTKSAQPVSQGLRALQKAVVTTLTSSRHEGNNATLDCNRICCSMYRAQHGCVVLGLIWPQGHRLQAIKLCLPSQTMSVVQSIPGCIQKIPDWVDNEISNTEHSLRSNTNSYVGKTD
jgi:hypothetical protein